MARFRSIDVEIPISLLPWQVLVCRECLWQLLIVAKQRMLSRWLAFLVVILSIWVLVAPRIAERLVVAKPLDRADVIFVLAGSGAYSQRAQAAATLYRIGIARHVLLTNDGERSGWSQKEQTNLPFVELARRKLVALGVPENAIEILPPVVSGTIEEAELLRKTAAERRWKALLIVTSARHTRRALQTFERVFSANGVETRIGIVPALNGPRSPPDSRWWLTRTGWMEVAGEYVKSAYYDLAY